MQKTFARNELPEIARELLAGVTKGESATVIALSGDLGAGKTSLTQALARELGVAGNVISPTFVIMKRYDLPRAECARGFRTLIHIDAYRLDSGKELEKLGWAEILSEPSNLVLIEWPERVKEIIPQFARRVLLDHSSEGDTRDIRVQES